MVVLLSGFVFHPPPVQPSAGPQLALDGKVHLGMGLCPDGRETEPAPPPEISPVLSNTILNSTPETTGGLVDPGSQLVACKVAGTTGMGSSRARPEERPRALRSRET